MLVFLENDDFGNITSKLFNDKQGSLTELGKFEDKGFRVVEKGGFEIYLSEIESIKLKKI